MISPFLTFQQEKILIAGLYGLPPMCQALCPVLHTPQQQSSLPWGWCCLNSVVQIQIGIVCTRSHRGQTVDEPLQ